VKLAALANSPGARWPKWGGNTKRIYIMGYLHTETCIINNIYAQYTYNIYMSSIAGHPTYDIYIIIYVYPIIVNGGRSPQENTHPKASFIAAMGQLPTTQARQSPKASASSDVCNYKVGL
jgi:hypothetical protein